MFAKCGGGGVEVALGGLSVDRGVKPKGVPVFTEAHAGLEHELFGSVHGRRLARRVRLGWTRHFGARRVEREPPLGWEEPVTFCHVTEAALLAFAAWFRA